MSGKYALIIGNTEYADPGLAQLTAPGKDAEDFARVLNDRDICAFDVVKVLLNQPYPIIREAIDEFFDQKKPDDLLVLYFSGHGVRDEYGSLYLTANNTNRARLRSTAIKSDFVHEAMDQSRSKRQVLILDCCNSGAFSQGTKAEVGGAMGIAQAFQGYGRFILTASDSTQFAWEGDKVIGETDNSLFTHYLVEGLEGEADMDGDGRITVDELYDYAYEKVKLATPKQTPSKFSSKQQGEIVLRQSIKIEDIKPIPLPDDLISEIEDLRPYVREVAVQKLEKLLKGKSIGLARSARVALERIADADDSRRVSQAASKALGFVGDDDQTDSATRTGQLRREQMEQAARFKAEQEKMLREKNELEERLREERKAREKIETEQLAKRKIEEGHPVAAKAEDAAFGNVIPKTRDIPEEKQPDLRKPGISQQPAQETTEQIKKESIWKFGMAQVWRGLIGTVLYVALSIVAILHEFGLGVAVAVFFGVAFGPWVGLITGLLGEIIINLFGLSESTLAILVGLTGLISGLTMKKISNFRRVQGILIVASINVVAVSFFILVKFGPDSYYILRGIFWSSVFLIAMMMIFATVVRPKQITDGRSSEVIKPITAQSLETAGRAMWFYQIWWTTLTKPKEEKYMELIEDQKATWRKAYWWVFASGLVGGILGFFTNGEVLSEVLYSFVLAVILLIYGLVLGILSVTGFALDSFITHVIANRQKGKGNYSSFAYLSAAINAPIMGINSFLVALAIPSDPSSWLGGISFFMILGLIYTAIPGTIAIKAINKFDLKRSIIAVIPSRLFLVITIIALSIYLSGNI